MACIESQQYPWTRVGISERRHYKLLLQFVDKAGGRYSHGQDGELYAAAVQVLISRGFGQDAARKWLGRHRREGPDRATT